ncbi:DUF1580 domain-containing protein [Bythopirellula polymerisocia]|uniref:Uncharacterized protein n=1 Tax=Bythopirellula polymerisocia TaxID=2528003 RepID=A0A5C6CVR5_9BACT|nr:DUF1580 domain-containing protein [Bythopirellula polymerisocia]TWU27541.1 hypothetical protein Pla144_23180 [Bythopirellula polymerisocia]
MYDLFSEEPISLNQVAKEEGVNPSTPWRWYLSGVRGVKLETIVVGGRRFSTRPALRRFKERCTAAANGASTTVRTPHQRERDIERAEKELAKIGV